MKPESWTRLAADCDQLLLSKREKHAFVGYSEADITFMPTYKYLNGTGTYDKKRGPAWTDRIMWKGSGGYAHKVGCEWYGRHELMDSDHKPVTGLFDIAHEIVDNEKQAGVFASLMKAARSRA